MKPAAFPVRLNNRPRIRATAKEGYGRTRLPSSLTRPDEAVFLEESQRVLLKGAPPR